MDQNPTIWDFNEKRLHWASVVYVTNVFPCIKNIENANEVAWNTAHAFAAGSRDNLFQEEKFTQKVEERPATVKACPILTVQVVQLSK